MCQEVFRLVQTMDVKRIETALALHCAPLITGIKISNLLMIESAEETALRVILRNTDIDHFRLLQTGDKSAYLLFRRKELEAYVLKSENRKFLMDNGYENFKIGYILRTFQKRYQAYMNQEDEFPHEMGILLGYPCEDVLGFITNNGQNYLYSGYWKVYRNVAEKKELFRSYEEAKENLIQLLANNISMKLIFEFYTLGNSSGFPSV